MQFQPLPSGAKIASPLVYQYIEPKKVLASAYVIADSDYQLTALGKNPQEAIQKLQKQIDTLHGKMNWNAFQIQRVF